MQRTILSQWFLFLVPDLKISRLHIVSVVCVSGALVDLDFLFLFFPFCPISISHLSLFATFPFFFLLLFLFLFCRSISFTYTLLLLPNHTRKLSFFSLLFTANLEGNISF